MREANAALQMDQRSFAKLKRWKALEVLDEVEQIAEDMDEADPSPSPVLHCLLEFAVHQRRDIARQEFREQILDDVREQREEIKAIERKAAKSFNNMFKAMGDKQAS
ncbi:unnamed protein product [Effrenium voratum]|nr:unnamed protein product [Effrenium voratum]